MEQIKAAAKKADELIEELARQARGEEAEAPETPEETTEPVLAESDSGVQAEPQEEPQAAPDEQDQLREAAAKWEQRYRSLDGMIQSRDRQIEQLHQLLADMQASKTEAKKAEPKKALVTKEDEETFGADLLDVARRVAREENAQYIQALEAKLAQFEGKLGTMETATAETAQERFETRLGQVAPNWHTVDRDPNFITWLQGSPTRLRIFKESVQSQDLMGVAQFYLDYDVLTGKQTEVVVSSTDNQSQPVDPRLARQVSPGKSRSSPTPITEGNKRQWTRTGIADFFTNRKKYPVDEANRIERDIFAAQKEDRVDYSR